MATEAFRELERAKTNGIAFNPETEAKLHGFRDTFRRPIQTLVQRLQKIPKKKLTAPPALTAATSATVAASTEAAEVAASFGLAADYLELAAETLDRALNQATVVSNKLAKDVPTAVAAMRNALQTKTTKSSASGRLTSWLSESQVVKVDSNKMGTIKSSQEVIRFDCSIYNTSIKF